jgi:hypothetical protein
MNIVFEKLSNLTNFINNQDVNFSGIRRFSPSPVMADLNRLMCDPELKVLFKNVNFSFTRPVDSCYLIPSGVTHSPEDWCGSEHGNPGVANLFEFLSAEYLNDIRNKKAFLLLDQSHEGYHSHWFFDWLHQSCIDFKISPCQIIFVTGNLNINQQYDFWLKEKDITERCLLVPNPHFEKMVNVHSDQHLSANDQIEYKKNHSNIKVYNALQKRPRAHRIWLFNELYSAGLLECGINSMNSFRQSHSYYANRSLTDEEYQAVIKFLPMTPPSKESLTTELQAFSDQDSGKYITNLNSEITLDSWVSVISESFFAEDNCFISEKTFKPIACSHPFIVFGNKGSLENLRKMGYKTFHPLIDESYDELETWERLSAIGKAIKDIENIPPADRLEWFIGMKDILEHNKNILHERTTRVNPVIINILNYCKELYANRAN